MDTQNRTLAEIPAFLNGTKFTSLSPSVINGVDGEPLAKISQVPVIRIHELQNQVGLNFQEAQEISVARFLENLKKAAQLLRSDDWQFSSFTKSEYCELVAHSTGLPKEAIPHEILEMAKIMEDMEAILSVQLPGNLNEVLDHHHYKVKGNQIGYFPSGKSLLIVVPGNIPTICLYWLIPLAFKRPVWLVPSEQDSFTHLILLEAISEVDPELASLVSLLPSDNNVLQNLIQISDQVILPESKKHLVNHSVDLFQKTYFIHYGRTKLLVDGKWDKSTVDFANNRMNWNFGRTCTGLTAVIVKNDALDFCERLTLELNRRYTDDFYGDLHRLPLFDPEKAEQINQMIEELIDKEGAIDVTEDLRGQDRLIIRDGKAMLLPTVLWFKKNPETEFGLELPFPFISVIECQDEAEQINLSKNTLILSVISQNKGLVKRLCYEPSIRKVFSGEEIGRGYNYLDPHEGFMADFLFEKKAIAG